MDYPKSWSLQSRRKQPSLYDEYLSQERGNGPSSPRADIPQPNWPPTSPVSRSSPIIHNSDLTIKTFSSNTSNVDNDGRGADDASASSAILPATTTRSFERDFLSIGASLTPDSPTTGEYHSPARRAIPSPITTSTPGSPIHALRAIRAASPVNAVANPRAHRHSPVVGTSSATSSPVSATFPSMRSADMTAKARRRYGSMGSADLIANQTAAPPPSTRLPEPPTGALPPLPPSASHPTIVRPAIPLRPSLAPSISQPAFAVASSYLASPSFVRPQSSRSDLTNISDPLPTANIRRVLHLMKTFCGRMSGGLDYRRSPLHAWTSVYCFIEELEGCLMCETESDNRMNRFLISDLRGCRVTCQLDTGTETPYLLISTPTSPDKLHLRVHSQADLESWYAALLCWQPIQRKGTQGRLPKPQRPVLAARASVRGRSDSEPVTTKEASIVRIGRMVYWDTHVSFGNTLPMTTAKHPVRKLYNQAAKAHGARRWRRVSCTLRENGELKFFTEVDNQVVAVVHLSQLCREAVVRLDPSVMDVQHCIAIFPQYVAHDLEPQNDAAPIYLSLESRSLWGVWYVLLSAFTVPNSYGPKIKGEGDEDDDTAIDPPSSPTTARTHTFRSENILSVRVNDARVKKDIIKDSPAPGTPSPNLAPSPDKPCGFYVDIIVDGQLRGKTQIKDHNTSPSWRQDFELTGMPPVPSSTCILLKYRTQGSYASSGKQGMPYYHDAYGQLQGPQSTNADTGFVGVFRDEIIGRVVNNMEDLESHKDSEHWWPVLDDQNTKVAEILIRFRPDESVILCHEEYDAFSRMLHKFEAGATVQMSYHIPMELKRLSEVLVNIFQCSGRIVDWFMSLIEEEVDGVNKDSFLSKSKFNQQPQSGAAAEHDRYNIRELAVRDMNKNATLEANLLFRGNTLLTRALDVHMRRVGSDFLVSALGPAIEDINDADVDCEVDPNRVTNANDIQRNWTRLIAATEKVWEAITNSASNCPAELKLIFRHIRACAEDKYGDFLRTIRYSSISGFVFLRLFCPAVLTPKLFGLLKTDPQPRSRRTFTLIAKSLQTLANMATFGSKEHWMEPMNAFLTSNRSSFKTFIDKVCFMAVEPSAHSDVNPAYSTVTAIRNRLPLSSTEGLPSLPYLLDAGKEYAALIDLWLYATGERRKSSVTKPLEDDRLIQAMHSMCKGLRQRAEECLYRAEKARRPAADLGPQWEEIVDALQANSTLPPGPASFSENTAGDETAVLVQQDKSSKTASTGLDALRISGTEGMAEQLGIIGATPPIEQLDWTSAPDGGAATATAASLLAGERSPRSGFVLSSPNLQPASSPSSPMLVAFHPAKPPVSDPLMISSRPTSAPSSRPGSSLSMRAASRLTRLRSGPGSDTEEFSSAGNPRQGSTHRERSRQRRKEERAAVSATSAATKPDLVENNKTTSSSKQDRTALPPLEREARESERQRIRDLVNGFTFGRRRAAEKADKADRAEKAAAAAAEKAAANVNGGGTNIGAMLAFGASTSNAASGHGGPGQVSGHHNTKDGA